MTRSRTWVVALAVSLMGAGSLRALAEETSSPAGAWSGFAAPAEHPVTAELIAEHTNVQPGGSTRIGVLFELQAGWHIYAQDPGDAGLPTMIEWSIAGDQPQNATIGTLHWPPHKEFLEAGDIHTFGYDDTTLLSATLTLASTDKATGSADDIIVGVIANIKWLACKDVCIPGSSTQDIVLSVTSGEPLRSIHAGHFPQESTSPAEPSG